jgi:tetratricopeptide (TPR) repeat protein
MTGSVDYAGHSVRTFCTRLAVCLAMLGACAAPAAAQNAAEAALSRAAFRDALIGFHSKLAGDEGNEGPAILAALQRMSDALGAWNDQNPAYGDDLRRGLALEAMGRDADALAAFRRAWDLDREDAVSAYLLASRTPADATSPLVGVLLKVLERRFISLPSDRHVDLVPEIALVPDRAAVTPVFSPALYTVGFRLLMDGRYADAIASFRAASARDPLVTGGPGESHRLQAAVYADAGNDAKSIEELEAAVRLAPDDERSGVALGRALAHAGRTEQAERVLLDTLKKLPQSADAHSALADLYDKNRGRDALREIESAASLPILAGKAALYYRLADLEHRHLEYERVIDPLVRRVRLIPNDARAHTDLGLALARVGRSGDALVELIMAALLGPDDAEALAAIGEIHFEAENYGAGETILRRAIAATPTYAKARYLLAQTLARLGRTRESQEQLAEYDRLRAAANEETRKNFEKER